MHSKAIDNRTKQTKSMSTLNGIISPKNASRKKTHSNKDKSNTKKPRKPAYKQLKMEPKPSDYEDEGFVLQQREQYYNNQKVSESHKSFTDNISEHAPISKKKVDSSQFTNVSDCHRNNNQYGTPPKIKLDCFKGVISFEGKMVKNKKKGEEPEHTKNYTKWEVDSQDFTTQLHINRDKTSKSQKKQGKSKSKGKNEKVSTNKSKNRTQKVTEFQVQHESNHASAYKNVSTKPQTSNTIKSKSNKQHESQETLSIPPNIYKYQRNESIDFELVRSELSEDEKRQERHKNTIFSMKKILYEQRCSCINMISKICSAMQYKKQTFGLAVQIFDVYLGDQVLYRKMKILGLSCLQLALKLEQAENAYNLMLIINSMRDKSKKQPLERKEEEEKGIHQSSVQKPREKSKKKKPNKKKIADQLKAAQFHQKKNLFFTILAQEIPEEEVNRQEMVEFEILIFLKFEFKLWTKTFSYWIDLLTLLWDQFLINQDQSEKAIDLILFRCPSNMKNFSLLTQIIEACLYSQQAYDYPKSIVVLSVIYMLVRINMEGGTNNAYSNYKQALVKSSNVLFIDRVGCNVLFGTFLLKLQIEMGAILSCCQFVSNYLDIEPYCTYEYLQKLGRNTNYDESLSYHFHNPKIYQHYCNESNTSN